MRIKNLFVLICTGWMLCCGPTVSAQDADVTVGEKKSFRGFVGMTPQYLTLNGLRLDYDLRLTPNHWLQVAPVVFYSESMDERNFYSGGNFSRHIGGGGHLYHRYYPGPGFGDTPIYISYGFMYHHNRVEYDEVIGQTRFKRNTTMTKMGFDVIIGLTAVASDIIMVDLFTGMGVRYSQSTSDALDPLLYDTGWISPGYSGNIMLLGMRIGFVY